MLQEERYEKILTALAETGFLTIGNVQELFDISPATARRDFIELEKRKLVERYRGGIRLKQEKKDSGLPPLEIRKAHCAIEKQMIARRAINFIKPSDVIIMDGGTTTLQMVPYLPTHPLTVITNSIVHALSITETYSESSHIEIVSTGGIVFSSWALTYGPPALSCLSEYHANWLFLSGQGINQDGLFNPHALVVETERAMVTSAEKIVVLADSSKIGKHSMSRVCGLDKIDFLITVENKRNSDLLSHFHNEGIKVITVSG
jgi:DeoR/GlpR family transcriptional regulator of sugar metabolism